MLICTFCWNLRQIVKSALISGETVLNYSVILKFISDLRDYTAVNFRGQKQLIDLYAFNQIVLVPALFASSISIALGCDDSIEFK